MARAQHDQPLVPSVLDRLLDDNPAAGAEPIKNQHQVLREMKLSVQRDLQNLLNTRWRCVSWPPDLENLQQSLVNYGIPDFTGVKFASAVDGEEFRKVIETVIKKYEPRFQKVTVRILRDSEERGRVLRLRIDAMLYAEPAPEPVSFDTTVEASTGNFEVKGADA